ncbi:ferredoxin--NAD+ reductase protein [Halorhabdus tiamatea SARL4B]|uniref:FAD-dependent pyridine nucleotide-disulfide oxidoreductase n=1 Tax=Halorhabdus tiamatea SARL4B TaxID=1033806 RepID=F7PNM0_9EURY|nr:FAD-dependent oxidoreductase [Halorhabdus tiamatea]ERJ05285.1 ferredoxin--NAD+ reductase protein [Halorhabdus tiamatea SARL4B]CCQ33744.1 FAD-dependent pyridine nucleotide-disulfide oxidoreductase [Halorhabdus tiamatea SARL4B]
MSETFLVVGGDAAGMSAASKAKREAPDRDVVVLERSEWVSYGACGLPYYVKGEIDSLEDLVAIPADRFREERDIDLRTGHEATAIDREDSAVTVGTDDGEEYTIDYDELLIATGAGALEPPIDGLDATDVFTLQEMDAGRQLKEAVETGEYDRIGIIGGGYIGIEMAEAFRGRDIDVTLFEMRQHVLPPFGTSSAETVEDELEDNGVDVRTGTRVEAIDGDGSVEAVRTDSGDVPVDAVLVAAGVDPNVELAEEAGIDLGPTGAIATDEYGRTNEEAIYAAGDCAEMTHAVTGEPAHVPLALTANRAGRAVGATVGGDPTPVGDIAGTAVLKAFDREVARTGILDAEELRAAGFDPVSVTITSASRAHYYPGGSEIEITLVGDADSGRVLGASMVGREGVAKRIDPIATAIQSALTVEDVEYLDLSYAPPFGPTWDPVLTAAKVLNGKL